TCLNFGFFRHDVSPLGEERDGAWDVEPADEKTPALRGCLLITSPCTGQESFSDEPCIEPLPSLRLQTEQQGGDSRDEGGCVAAAACPGDAATRLRSRNVLAQSKDALRLVRTSPVAELKRRSVGIHGADCKDR